MTSPLTFTAACNQFGNAAYGIACAAWRSPFMGGRVRMITIGLPLLFITAGIGALIFSIMTAILFSLTEKLSKMAYSLCRHRSFLENPRTYQYSRQDRNRQNGKTVPIPRPSSSDTVLTQSQTVILTTDSESVLVPDEIGKERNESFSKLIDLLDKYTIEPWIIQNQPVLEKGGAIDPLFQEMVESPEKLKAFLRCIVLWQFGIIWDKGERQYLTNKMAPPSTLESIQKEIEALGLNSNLESELLSYIFFSEKKSEEEVDQQIARFQHLITNHTDLNGKKNMLITLSLRLNGILKNKPKTEEEIEDEERKLRFNFSVGMNDIVANSFMHIAGIIEGVMSGINKTSSHEIICSSYTEEKEKSEPLVFTHPTQYPQDLDADVTEMITVVSKMLRDYYSTPLYTKYREKWESIAKKNQRSESITKQFLEGKTSDLGFLQSNETHCLSTKQISAIFFLKAALEMESREHFQGFIQRIPESLLNQIKPAFIGILNKSTEMLSEISMERTIVKTIGFLDKILNLCDAMQLDKTNREELQDESFPSSDGHMELIQALEKGGLENHRSVHISQLYIDTPHQDTQGEAIIGSLENSAHEVIQPFQKDPIQAERDWIKDKILQFKRLLRETTSDYTKKQEGQWLAKLLENKVDANGWIGIILDIQGKIKTYFPTVANILKILLGGLQKFIEDEGIPAIQESLDKISSAGKLSSTIAIAMMKSFFDLSTDDLAWQKNLPFLKKAYIYLSPEEQQRVKTHLKFLYIDSKLIERENDLIANPETPNEKTQELLQFENTYSQSLSDIEKANKMLQKDPETNKGAISELQKAYDKLKTQKGLIQFERVKGLILFIANHHLSEKFNRYYGGSTGLSVVMSIIEEAFELLRYQKVVKHWIFTIVDFIIKELQITHGLTSSDQKDSFESKFHESEKQPSISDIIEAHKLNEALMTKLATTASNCNRSWGKAGMLASINYTAATWTGPIIWKQIKKPFEDVYITPHDLAMKAIKTFTDFGKDPSGLSTIIIETLTEHFADSRSKEPRQVFQEINSPLPFSNQIKQEDFRTV